MPARVGQDDQEKEEDDCQIDSDDCDDVVLANNVEFCLILGGVELFEELAEYK